MLALMLMENAWNVHSLYHWRAIIYALRPLLNAATTVELSSIGDIFDRVERNATASFVVDLRGMRIVTRDKSSRGKRS